MQIPLLERMRSQIAAALEESEPLEALRVLAGPHGAGGEIATAASTLALRLGLPGLPAARDDKEEIAKPWI